MRARLIVAFILTLAAASSFASDWPGWRGLNRDGHVPDGAAVPDKLPAEPKVLWRVPTADGFASPVVAEGKVVLLDFAKDKPAEPAAAPAAPPATGAKPPKKETPAGREIVRALNIANGDELWHQDLDSQHKDGFGTGPRCTPLVYAGKVYAQSTKGQLKCLDLVNGKVLWQKNYITDFGQKYIGEKGDAAGASRHGNAGSPLVDGDHLIALVGAEGASIVCFNKDTGDIVWKTLDEMVGYAPPVVLTLAGAKQYVVFTAVGLIGLNPADGKLLWRMPIKTRLGRHVTTPVAIGDTVIVSSHEAGILGIKVSKDSSGFKAEQIWVNKPAATNFASPLVAGDHIYSVGPASDIVCVDAKGETAWQKSAYLGKNSGQATAAMMLMGKNVLALTDTGELVLFADDTKEFKEVGHLKVCGQTWCNPPYADGKLYVRDGKELQCIELAK